MLRCVVSIALCLSSWLSLAADEPALSLEQRRERVKSIRALIETLEARVGLQESAQPLKLLGEPSLLYADNERELSDASLWVWEWDGLPALLSTAEFRPKDGTGGVWSFECVSLTPQALRVKLPVGEWTVPAGAVSAQPLAGAPTAAMARGPRLVQMRKLADRFSATAYSVKQGRIELRRLAAPVYRQPESLPGDGALFAYANGTNPEVIVSIQTDKPGGTWTYAVASLSGDAASANLDEKEIWRVERYTGPGARLTYTNGRLKTEPPR